MQQGQTMNPGTNPRVPSFGSYGGTAAENYDRFFVPSIGAPVAADLVAYVAPRPGERVLDVACGTGVATKLAAARVGVSGTAAGADINTGMLDVARATTPDELAIDWYVAPADAMPFADETFDVVLCQFGLQFFQDRLAALREMRRVSVPDGRVAINVPGPTPPLFRILEEALAEHVGIDVARFVDLVFSLHETDEIGSLLDDTGFDDVVVRGSTRTLQLPPPAVFLWQYIHSTPLAPVVTAIDDAARATLERVVHEGWRPYTRDAGLVLDLPVTTATARAPVDA